MPRARATAMKTPLDDYKRYMKETISDTDTSTLICAPWAKTSDFVNFKLHIAIKKRESLEIYPKGQFSKMRYISK